MPARSRNRWIATFPEITTPLSESVPRRFVIPAHARGRPVAERWRLVRLAAVVVVTGLVPGCFYTARLNQRSSAIVYRGDTVHLTSTTSDPDLVPVSYQWRAYACTDAELRVGAR